MAVPVEEKLVFWALSSLASVGIIAAMLPIGKLILEKNGHHGYDALSNENYAAIGALSGGFMSIIASFGWVCFSKKVGAVLAVISLTGCVALATLALQANDQVPYALGAAGVGFSAFVLPIMLCGLALFSCCLKSLEASFLQDNIDAQRDDYFTRADASTPFNVTVQRMPATAVGNTDVSYSITIDKATISRLFHDAGVDHAGFGGAPRTRNAEVRLTFR